MRFWKLFSDRQKKASTYNGLLLSKRTSSVCPTSLHIKDFFCQTASATSFILYPRVLFFSFFFVCMLTDRRRQAHMKEFFCQKGLLLSNRTSSVKRDFLCQKGLLLSVQPHSFYPQGSFFFFFFSSACWQTGEGKNTKRNSKKKGFRG